MISTSVLPPPVQKLGMFELPGMKGLSQTMTAATVLDAGVKVRMNPLELRKAGAIIDNMQAAEYSNEQINHICRALFCDQSEEDMRRAWEVFDAEDRSYLDATEFKKVLPLMGESVPEEQISALFEEADSDGSGKIEFDEFMQLVRAMNPKEQSAAEDAAPESDPDTTQIVAAPSEREEGSAKAPEPDDTDTAVGQEEPAVELNIVPGLVDITDLTSNAQFGVELKILCFRNKLTRGVPEIVTACGTVLLQNIDQARLFEPNESLEPQVDQLQHAADSNQKFNCNNPHVAAVCDLYPVVSDCCACSWL